MTPLQFCLGSWAGVPRAKTPPHLSWSLGHALFLSVHLLLTSWHGGTSGVTHDCTTEPCSLSSRLTAATSQGNPSQGPLPAEGKAPAQVLWSPVSLPLSATYGTFHCRHVLGKGHHSTGEGRGERRQILQFTLCHGPRLLWARPLNSGSCR